VITYPHVLTHKKNPPTMEYHPIQQLNCTELHSVHHTSIHCHTCHHTVISDPSCILQITPMYIHCEWSSTDANSAFAVISDNNAANNSGAANSPLQIFCPQCNQILGFWDQSKSPPPKKQQQKKAFKTKNTNSKEEEQDEDGTTKKSSIRLFRCNKMKHSSVASPDTPLIDWSGSQEEHKTTTGPIHHGGGGKKTRSGNSLARLKLAIQSVDFSQFSEAELQEMERFKREEFDTYYLMRFDREKNENLANEQQFEQLLDQYEDKDARAKWQWFQEKLNLEFAGHSKLYCKMREIIVSYLLMDIEAQPEFKVFRIATELELRQRVCQRLLLPSLGEEDAAQFAASPRFRIPLGTQHESVLNDDNVGHDLIYIDLAKANFNSLRVYSPELVMNCATWKEWIQKETDSVLLQESGQIRHKVFGKINFQLCRKKDQMMKLQREVLNVIYNYLTTLNAENSLIDETQHETAFICSCDEIFIRTTRDRLSQVYQYVRERISSSPTMRDMVHLGSFRLHNFSYDSPTSKNASFYVKQMIHHNEKQFIPLVQNGSADDEIISVPGSMHEAFEIKGILRETREDAYKYFDQAIQEIKDKK